MFYIIEKSIDAKENLENIKTASFVALRNKTIWSGVLSVPLLFIAMLLSILLINNIILGQTKMARQKYWTYGFNLGYLGIAPSSKTDVSGTTFNNGASSKIIQDNGRGRYTLDLGSSIGLNAGLLWKDKNSKNFTGIQVDFQQNRNTHTLGNPFIRVIPSNANNDMMQTIPFPCQSLG